METVTITKAKARLNELILRAEHGEEIVLMRGSRHVACIVPIREEDLELAPRLTDAQARRLWDEIGKERKSGRALEFESPAEAVETLRRKTRKRRV